MGYSEKLSEADFKDHIKSNKTIRDCFQINDEQQQDRSSQSSLEPPSLEERTGSFTALIPQSFTNVGDNLFQLSTDSFLEQGRGSWTQLTQVPQLASEKLTQVP